MAIRSILRMCELSRRLRERVNSGEMIMSLTTDYRDLLKRYVKLIAQEEGTIFVTSMQLNGFSMEDIAAIDALECED